MRRLVSVLLLAAVAFTAAACGEDQKGLGDAPVGTRHEAPREVIVNPDQFHNVLTECDGHGNRVYVTTGDYFTVIPNDPTCAGVKAGKR